MGKKQNAADPYHQCPVKNRQKAVGAEKLQCADIGTQVKRKGDQKLVQYQEEKKVKLDLPVTDEDSGYQAEYRIHHSQQKFKTDDVRKVLFYEETVLGNVPVVVIGDPEVKDDVENHGEIEKSKIQAIIFCPHHILNRAVDPQDPKRLNQQVKGNQQKQVGYEFAPQIFRF